jgi:hypothetical protein
MGTIFAETPAMLKLAKTVDQPACFDLVTMATVKQGNKELPN